MIELQEFVERLTLCPRITMEGEQWTAKLLWDEKNLHTVVWCRFDDKETVPAEATGTSAETSMQNLIRVINNGCIGRDRNYILRGKNGEVIGPILGAISTRIDSAYLYALVF